MSESSNFLRDGPPEWKPPQSDVRPERFAGTRTTCSQIMATIVTIHVVTLQEGKRAFLAEQDSLTQYSRAQP
jgi:hypothetical protein